MRKLIFFIVFLFFSAATHAATVGLAPTDATVNIGDTFSFDIIGNFSELEALDGGGLNLSFTSSIVNVTNVTVNTSLFEFFTIPGAIDNTTGTVDGIVFNTTSVPGVSGQFLIGTIDFMAIGNGLSDLMLTEYAQNPFSSSIAGTSLAVDYLPSTVTVVPLPAAFWLLLSGITLFGTGCRKKKRA